MVRTRAGYSGGIKLNPTYHNLGDHSETIRIDYDPNVISYDKLLDVFWDSHDTSSPSWSKQYMSIIFYHSEEQKRLAIESKEREAARIKSEIFTLIHPAGRFYQAENYHQKYKLRSEREIFKELSVIYPDAEDFVNSTAAARINGYLDGYGTLADLQEELAGFGLSPQAEKQLISIVKSRKGKTGCPIGAGIKKIQESDKN